MHTSNTDSEKFCWLASAETSKLGLTLATGHGAVTRTREAQVHAHGTLEDVRSGAKPGLLMRSSAIVLVEGASEMRFLLVTDDDYEEPGKWRFPCAYSRAPGEPAASAAIRSLEDNFDLHFRDNPSTWGALALKLDGATVTLLGPELAVDFRGRSIRVSNTLEFFNVMQLRTVNPDIIRITDKRGRGRQARLFTPGELFALSQSRNISTAARALWGHAIAEGALAFINPVLRFDPL